MYIRKTLTALLIGSAIILPTANAEIIEMITNGDFATGDFTGWSQEVLGQQIIEDGTARLINNTGAVGPSVIRQNQIQAGGLLTPGQDITISFDYRGTLNAGAVVFASVYSHAENGGVNKTDILNNGGPLFPAADPTTWTTYTTTTTLGSDVSGGISFLLQATTGAVPGSSADIYFDNISVMGQVIPEPTSALLIVGSAGALGMIRRNKKYFTNYHKID
jgi:hypothetical protein